ncbi:MAG: HAMP domain-containing histidine kinase [Armatimonadetes bacterium]|nr:HAMP domain-containing histidine kinase [Armatimonadota bacterium]
MRSHNPTAAVIDAQAACPPLLNALQESNAAVFVLHDSESSPIPSGLPDGSVNVWSDQQQRLADRVAAALDAANLATGDARETVERRLLGLRDKQRDLQAELEAKSRFLANVSHELRTPLTSIREFASLTLDEIAGPVTDDQRDFQRTIISNVDHLSAIIQDLLLMSEAEQDGLHLALGPLEMNRTIQRALDQTPWKSANQADISVTVPQDLPLALGDDTRIVQVLTNLLSNALKFTPAEGHIRISAQASNSEIRVSVEDTGRGIAKHDLFRIFDRFYQVADPDGPSRKGTGLGLNIVKSIVEAHGGAVGVTSEAGKGSTFWFTLPIFSLGAWLQSSDASGSASRAPIVVTVRMQTTARGRRPQREDLERTAELLKRALRKDDRLVTVPAAECVYVLAQGRRSQGLSLRDRLAQVIRDCTDDSLREFGFEITLEDPDGHAGQRPRAAA